MEFKGTDETWFLSGLEIVSMPSQVKICKVSGSTYDEAKANALLISKAPEMLEILMELTNLKSSSFILDELQERAREILKESTQLKP